MDSIKRLVEAIVKESGKPESEVERLIDEKKTELSGLVSEEGAAYIVGRELGVSLIREGKRSFKIKNLVDGLRGIDFVGRIVNISDVREFEWQGKKGRVLSVTLGDDTGVVRMPLWNQEIDVFSELKLGEDDVISISSAWVKLDNRGSPELRLGRGKIEKSKKKISLPEKGEMKMFSEARRMPLAGVKEGDFPEIRGCLVQLYRRNPFFETCPDCNSKLMDDEKPRCKEHGIVKPETNMVVSGVLDDGTANIRVVFFRELAEQLFGEKAQGLKQMAEKAKDPLQIFDQFKGMGKDFIVRGRVKLNDFTSQLELVASHLGEVDTQKEAGTLLKKLEGK